MAGSRCSRGGCRGRLVSGAYIAALSSPWARLYGSDLEPDLSSLPASPELIHRAKLAVALREAVVLALPSAAIIVAFGPSTEGLATAGAVAAGALLLTLGLTFATRRLGAASGRAAGVVVAALIVGVGVSF